VLFEVSSVQVDFDFDYGKDCSVQPWICFKYRTVDVKRDRELEVGRVSERLAVASSDELAHWLEDRGSLVSFVEAGYKDSVWRTWYPGLPTR
jgi:hypothetical protein